MRLIYPEVKCNQLVPCQGDRPRVGSGIRPLIERKGPKVQQTPYTPYLSLPETIMSKQRAKLAKVYGTFKITW